MVGLENYYRLLHTPDQIAKYDEVWVVMLYAPRDIPGTFRHVRGLAPTLALYRQFKALKDKGQWGQSAFNSVYAPQYVSNLLGSPESLALANELIGKASAGRNIALVCTCYHEELCHRALLGGLIREVTSEVEVISEQDYRQYWR